jgi:uncharacterized protein
MRTAFSVTLVLLAVIALLFLFGCSAPEAPTRRSAALADPIEQERAEKDREFRSETGSPIPAEERSGFHGLAYYPVTPQLRFSLRLARYSSPKQVRLGTNTGEIRSGVRYGYFEFQAEGRLCRLQVYRLEDVPDSGGADLFIPFRDPTSGQETYPSGRYIDLKENTSGIYELDFNRAYNPYCAYNARFSCPVPPAENTLPVPIRAGEKKYIPHGIR